MTRPTRPSLLCSVVKCTSHLSSNAVCPRPFLIPAELTLAGFPNDIFNQCLLLCVACLSTGGDSAAFWNVWWYDGSLTRPVPICIRSPLSPPPSLKLQIFGSAQHLSHMRSRPHLEYQMFFPVWGSLVLIIRLSLHIRKILYFTKSCLLYQFPPPLPYHSSLFSTT